MSESRRLRIAATGLAAHERALAARLFADRRVAGIEHRGLEAALDDPRGEVVWLGGAADLPAAHRAIAAARPLLLSVPPAVDLESLDALEAAARVAGVPVAVRHRRASPPFAQAAARVAEGRVGLPRAVHVHLLEAGAAAPAEVLLFEAVDAARAITGLDPVAVHATAAAAGPGATVAMVELQRDVPLTVVAGRTACEDPVGGGLRRIVLVGSQAMLALEEDRPRLEVRGRGGSRAGDGGAGQAIAAALAGELLGIVRGGRQPVCGLADARPALATVLAARRAARSLALVPSGEHVG